MDINEQLRQIARERDIAVEELQHELELALAVAYKKFVGIQGDITIKLDPSTKSGAVVLKEVVGELLDPDYAYFQVTVENARRKMPEAEIGDFVPYEIDTVRFGRIAAQTFKQVLQQKLRDVEMRRMHEMFEDKLGDVMTAVVTRREDSSVRLQIDGVEVELPRREQISTDDYRPNSRMRVYVLKMEERGPAFRVVVSRSHPNLARKLLEAQVPEIDDGLIEIVSVAREPGQRTKIAVKSLDPRIDPVGACVGPRGTRIQALMDELRPEKIDVIPYVDDPKAYIQQALSPAKTNSIRLDTESQSAYVIVPDTQLSLAIGRGGQNVRLAARLTEWKIDIRSESQAAEESSGKKPAPAASAEPQSEHAQVEETAGEAAATE